MRLHFLHLPSFRWILPLVALAGALVAPASAVVVFRQSSAARSPIPGASTGVSAFVNVNVVPMDAERVLANQTVLIEAGWITALGPATQVHVPAGAVRIDGRGQYLIPGLADMHVHFTSMLMGNLEGSDNAWRDRQLLNFLAQGVTTIRNMDHESLKYESPGKDPMLWLKARTAAGILLGPHIYTSGAWAPRQYTQARQINNNTGPTPRLDSVAAYVAAYKALGYDHIKPYNEGRPVFDSLLVAARRLGIPVAGHLPQRHLGSAKEEAIDTTLTLELALTSGVYRSIEHLMGYWTFDTFNVAPAWLQSMEANRPARIAATVKAGLWNTPTIASYEYLAGEGAAGNPDWAAAVRRITKALQDAGAGLLLGSDVAMPIIAWSTPSVVHHELAELTWAGLTPYQALLTGTRNPAAYFGTLDRAGTVAPGKQADLVLLSGNPLQDIRRTREPVGVMVGGRWLDRAELDRRLSDPLARPSGTSGTLAGLLNDMRNGFGPKLERAVAGAFKQDSKVLSALNDSLAQTTVDANERGRLLRRLVEQFGVMRARLIPEQRESFDPAVRIWLREQARQGNLVEIPGIRSAP